MPGELGGGIGQPDVGLGRRGEFNGGLVPGGGQGPGIGLVEQVFPPTDHGIVPGSGFEFGDEIAGSPGIEAGFEFEEALGDGFAVGRSGCGGVGMRGGVAATPESGERQDEEESDEEGSSGAGGHDSKKGGSLGGIRGIRPMGRGTGISAQS